MLAFEAVVGQRLHQMDLSMERLGESMRTAFALLLQRRRPVAPASTPVVQEPTKMIIRLKQCGRELLSASIPTL